MAVEPTSTDTHQPAAAPQNDMAIISGGVDVAPGEDGMYYEKLGVDSKGEIVLGSLMYCDFTGITGVFSNPIATVDAYNADGSIAQIKGMIDMGGFDFTKTENDLYILSILEKYNGNVEAADAYLRQFWGEDYDANAESYQLRMSTRAATTAAERTIPRRCVLTWMRSLPPVPRS